MQVQIDGIDYEFEKIDDVKYMIGKMGEYLNRNGLEKSVRSQKFIRHLHICIAANIHKSLKYPSDKIHFEINLHNKKVDLGLFDEDAQPFYVISIRSQISSIKKNFTNNINSLQGEVVSIKTSYPSIKVGLVYLLKVTDIDTKDECMSYYAENIPKKLLPMINTNIYSTDRFDAACLLFWDYKNGKALLVEDDYLSRVFDISSFMKDTKQIIEGKEIKSQFSFKDLDERRFIEFLKS